MADSAKRLRADGQVEDLRPANGKLFTLAELQAAVGGYIELVRSALRPTWLLVVNEDGRLQGLPLNQLASDAAGQPIVGDAVYLPRRMFR